MATVKLTEIYYVLVPDEDIRRIKEKAGDNPAQLTYLLEEYFADEGRMYVDSPANAVLELIEEGEENGGA